MLLPMRIAPVRSEHWRGLAVWPAASGALNLRGNREQLMFPLLASEDLEVQFLAFDFESTHELFRRNKSTADRDGFLKKHEAAILAEGSIILWIRYGLRVVAW